jgi:hypothetical protein
MSRKFCGWIFLVLTLAATGCAKSSPRQLLRSMNMEAKLVNAESPVRYIAERDKLEIVTSESDLQKSWDSAVAFCGTIQCEVISSRISMRTADSAPSGDVTLRVAPEDFQKLLANLEKLGKIEQHTTEREDKTTAVVDTEAKIKNLTSFRDSLRTMLGKPSATVNDLVQIQKQLADTQSELDSEAAQRKILANDTEKIAVEISFSVDRSSAGGGALSQIWKAFVESGSVLADSTASLITTIVAIIPWLILILPGIWFLLKAWRRLKLQRNQTRTPTS